MEQAKTSYSQVLANYAQYVYKKQKNKDFSFRYDIYSNDIDDLINDLKRAFRLLN